MNSLKKILSSHYPILFEPHSAKANSTLQNILGKHYNTLEETLLRSPYRQYFIKGEDQYNLRVLATLTHEGTYNMEREITRIRYEFKSQLEAKLKHQQRTIKDKEMNFVKGHLINSGMNEEDFVYK
jgi:hypothetical protein